MNNILSEKDTLAIQDIIIRQLDVQRDQLTPEARILADLGADSLDVVEISMTLEELFEVNRWRNQRFTLRVKLNSSSASCSD